MRSLVDIYVVYRIVKMISTPFVETDAYKLGIIDDKGRVLRSIKTLKTPAEKAAWTWFDILINNIKRALSTLPGGHSRFFTYAAALFLMKEPIKKLQREMVELSIPETQAYIWGPHADRYLSEAVDLMEDVAAPTNAVGGGAIAGTQNDPPMYFAGCRVFTVDSEAFQKCRLGKRKYARYEHYVAGPMAEAIRQYGKQKIYKGIIVQDSRTGAMTYLRYPRKKVSRMESVYGRKKGSTKT